MFNFFCNLALCVYYGQWITYSNADLVAGFVRVATKNPIFGLFNNSTEAFYYTASEQFYGAQAPDLAIFISVILSTICCIGVFWIIINSIRKLFSVFLEWF